MTIPHTSYGTGAIPLHFLHANGFPPECYRLLFARFSGNYHVISMLQRSLWQGSKPEEISDWKPLTDDFLRFLDEQNAVNVIAVGHSVGGIVALRAALREPQHFLALVVIDPVLFPPWIVHFWQCVRFFGLGHTLHPLVRATRNRRSQFDDLERLFRGYQQKPVFKYLDNEALRAYVEGITCPDDNGFKLCYSADWEAQIYATSVWHDMDIWRSLPGLKIPMLVIRGAETDTFWASTGRKVLQKTALARVVTIPRATHLVPLEQPEAVHQVIQEFIQETL